MTMSLQAISDRMEIQDLLVDYCYAVESHDGDALDAVFTEDAVIDYSSVHGSRGDLATAKRFLTAASPNFAGGQLMVATSKVTIDGDTAVGRTICHHPAAIDLGGGRTHVFFCGLWYNDRFVRTPQGWRIEERVAERCYYHNVPPEMAFLEGEHTESCACLAVLSAG